MQFRHILLVLVLLCAFLLSGCNTCGSVLEGTGNLFNKAGRGVRNL